MDKITLRLLISLAILVVTGQAQAVPLIDFTNDGSGYTWFGNDAGCNNGCTLGYSFNVTSSVTIDGLGVYDADSDGLNNNHQVGLWSSAGTLLASTSVGPGSSDAELSASNDGSFIFSDIASLTLGAGSYTVGALFQIGDTDHVVFGAEGIFSNAASVSYDSLQWVNTGAFQMPTNTSTLNDRYFGAGLRIGSASVPEPASIALMGLGLVGLGFSRRRKTKT